MKVNRNIVDNIQQNSVVLYFLSLIGKLPGMLYTILGLFSNYPSDLGILVVDQSVR